MLKSRLALKFAPTVLALCLTGCGGGGSTSGQPVQVTPTPAPAPAPSPTPTPTPTPIAVIDFSSSFAIETSFAYTFQWFQANGSGPVNAASPQLLGSSQTTELVFQPQAIEEMRFRFGDLFVVFGASDRLQTVIRAYRREPEQLAIERPFNYVARSTWRTRFDPETRNGQSGYRDVFKIGVIGQASPAGLPFPASLNYSGTPAVRGGTVDSDAVFETQLSNFSYTPSSKSVFGSVLAFQVVNSAQVQRASLRLDGSFDPTNNRLSGTISDSSFGWTGTYSGQFFGPDRNEVGLTFRVTNSSGAMLVGDYIGRR